MTTISLLLSPAQIEFLRKLYADSTIVTSVPYSLFQVIEEDCRITVYASHKTVFQGKNAEEHAALFQAGAITQTTEKTSSKLPKKAVSSSLSSLVFPQAGSDEVGTGDYFGPVVVCACITTQKDVDEFGSLNITDSKKMTDTAILEVAPKLMTALAYSLLVVDNDKYNEVHLKHNMNAIKAILHNQAYVHLKKKAGQLPVLCVVDQFSPAPNYFRYLEGESEIERNLHFETKAESKYFAVACASVIARYTFLKSFHAMEEHYSFSFPKGAGTHVDDAAVEFVKKFGKNKLCHVAKIHFKNTEKAENLNK